MEKTKNSKLKLYNVLLLICLYLISASIPFSLFIKNEEISYGLTILFRLSFILYYPFYIRKNNLDKLEFKRPRLYHFLFIPFLLITISNYIVALIDDSILNLDISSMFIIKEAILYLLVGIGEEEVFRGVLLPFINEKNSRFKAILYSSLIFGGVHLLNISSLSSIPYCLLQALYSFGTGLLFAFIYVYSKNIIYPIIVHFLFDLLNGSLIEEMFVIEWNLTFFIVNIAIALLICAYACALYFIFERRKKDVSDTLDN